MGLLVEWFALKADPGQTWRLFMTTGILGGFTTFSAFSLDMALMIERGTATMAGLYALASVITSVAGLFLGLLLIRQLA
jgi:CrcB protein